LPDIPNGLCSHFQQTSRQRGSTRQGHKDRVYLFICFASRPIHPESGQFPFLSPNRIPNFRDLQLNCQSIVVDLIMVGGFIYPPLIKLGHVLFIINQIVDLIVGKYVDGGVWQECIEPQHGTNLSRRIIFSKSDRIGSRSRGGFPKLGSLQINIMFHLFSYKGKNRIVVIIRI
jgi:hypothetical protein